MPAMTTNSLLSRFSEHLARLLLSRSVRFAAIATAIWAATNLIDPFGFDSSSTKYSQDVLNQLFGSLYPPGGQSQITVVLLTDETMNRREADWPPSRSLHAEALYAIGSYNPQAVFVDIYFPKSFDVREGTQFASETEELERALRWLGHRSRVYLAYPGCGREEGPFDSLMTSDPTSRVSVTKVPASVPVDPHSPIDRDYPLLIRCLDPAPNAALRIFLDREADDRSGRIGKPPATRGEDSEIPAEPPPRSPPLSLDQKRSFATPMAVAWGTKTASENLGWNPNCRQPPGLLTGLWRQFLWKPGRNLMNCPYHTTVLVDQLFLVVDDESGTIGDLIKDRTVVYGSRLTGARDWTYSPTHGPMPGAYLHAMALDNLMVFKDRYLARSPAIESVVEGLTTFISALLAWQLHRIMASVRVSTGSRTPGGRLIEQVLRDVFELIVLLAALLLVAVSTSFSMVYCLRLAPTNWIGVSTVVTLVRAAAGYPETLKMVLDYSDEVISGRRE